MFHKQLTAASLAAVCLLLAACGASPAAGTVQESAQTSEAGNESAQETESTTGTETEEETDTQTAAGGTAITDGVYEGIVVDAAMNSFTIDTAEGKMLPFTMPEDDVDLKEGMLLGIPVKVVVKDSAAVSLTDGTRQPKASRQALEFAGSILFAMEYKDMTGLSSLMGYPVYVNLGDRDQVIEDAESFEKLDAQAVFSRERVQAVLAVNLYELEELEGGTYVMGDESGKPNVIFQADEGNDRGFSVTGIN